MWEREVGGEPLTFHLAGINNQNFLMKDERTGSWWQQVSGKAIQGALKGENLKRVIHDEVTFGAWRREHPSTRVLTPDARLASHYAPENWEERIAAYPVVTPRSAKEPLRDRDLVVGVEIARASRAYLLSDLAGLGPVNDNLGGLAILVLPFEEGKSVRVFDRRVGGEALEFFAGTGADAGRLVDAPTGTIWSLAGEAVGGPHAGQRLVRVDGLLDYWFDWKTYHPDTDVYRAGR